MRAPNAFTLIELLVVVGIVAILSIATVLAINPSQLLAQSRDTTRLNDATTLNHALTLSQAESLNLGSSSVVYVSVPDATLAAGATSTCTSLGLPALPSPYIYQCVSTTSLQKADGNGWIPIAFTQMNSKPITILPIDPINTTSSGNYYTYTTNGTQFEVTAIPESQKQRQAVSANSPFMPGLIARGTNLALSPLFNPTGLVAYWNFNEGSGSTAYDSSGNGNNATWGGTQAGDAGTFYTTGKIGKGGYFNHLNDLVSINSPVNMPTGDFSISVWANSNFLAYNTMLAGNQFRFSDLSFNNTVAWDFTGNGYTSPAFPGSGWHHIVGIKAGTSRSVYADGVLLSSNGLSIGTSITGLTIGYNDRNALGAADAFGGTLDEMRIYNRALSAAEIQAIYNATK